MKFLVVVKSRFEDLCYKWLPSLQKLSSSVRSWDAQCNVSIAGDRLQWIWCLTPVPGMCVSVCLDSVAINKKLQLVLNARNTPLWNCRWFHPTSVVSKQNSLHDICWVYSVTMEESCGKRQKQWAQKGFSHCAGRAMVRDHHGISELLCRVMSMFKKRRPGLQVAGSCQRVHLDLLSPPWPALHANWGVQLPALGNAEQGWGSCGGSLPFLCCWKDDEERETQVSCQAWQQTLQRLPKGRASQRGECHKGKPAGLTSSWRLPA